MTDQTNQPQPDSFPAPSEVLFRAGESGRPLASTLPLGSTFPQRSDLLFLALLLIATGIAYGLHWSFTVDDAAISFSYARSFAQGFGLGALYPGAARVEGYSNLLWVLLLGSATWLGLETLLASKILGLSFALGVTAVLYLSLRPFVDNRWLLLGLALLPLSLTFSFWSVSGLENALYAFLITLSVNLLLQEERHFSLPPVFWGSPVPWRALVSSTASAVVLVLVAMTRPEGLVYGLAAAGFKLVQLAYHWRDPAGRSARLRDLLVWLGVICLGYGLFIAWRYWYFAAPWPNPIYAKANWYDKNLQSIYSAAFWKELDGWVYVRSFFRTTGALGLLPALAFGGVISLKGPQKVFLFFALAALVLPLFTPDWMVNFRFIFPFLPFCIALLILAADQLWTWLGSTLPLCIASLSPASPPGDSRPQRQPALPLRILAASCILVFGYGVARYAWANFRLNQRQLACGYEPMAETRCLDGKMYWSMAEVDAKYRELKIFAKQVGLDDAVFMIPDIGATSYVQKLRLLDLAGLADYQIARIDESALLKQYIFQEQKPDFIHTHGAWTRRTDLASFSALREDYLPVELGQDENGISQGTFVRRDLLVLPASTGATSAANIPGAPDKPLCELAPGLLLVSTTRKYSSAADRKYSSATTTEDTYWQASQPQDQDWNLVYRLDTAAGEQVMEQIDALGYGWYPPSQWQPGELIRQHISLPGDLPAGEYTLRLAVVDSDGQSPQSDGAPLVECRLRLSARKYSSAVDLPPAAGDALAEAQAAWQKLTARKYSSAEDGEPQSTGEIEALLSALKKRQSAAIDLARRREWQSLAHELRQAARQARMQDDWERAYHLSLGAVLANPDDAWAQRELAEARRNYLLDANAN